MSKLSELKRATLEDFPGAPEWFEPYLQFQNAFNEDVYGRVNGDIGLINTNNAIKAVKITHGVEKVFQNPLNDKRLRPVGVYAVRTDGLPVQGLTWRNIATPGQPDQIGVTVHFDNSAESIGYAGERVSSVLAAGSAVGLTTNTIAQLTSISLTPGSWLIDAFVTFNNVPTGGTSSEAGISTTAGATGIGTLGDSCAATPTVCNASQALSLAVPSWPTTVTTTTTHYLKARGVFTGGAMGAHGRITAVRTVPYTTGLEATVTLYVVGG